MECTVEHDNDVLTVKVTGSVDTSTAPRLEDALDGKLEGVRRLYFDLSDMDYISSIGLRIILGAHQTIVKNNGKVVLGHIREEVIDVFEYTGFLDIMEVEK